MKKFVIWVGVNALAILVATWLLDGITLTGSSTGNKALTLILVALIFGVVNGVVGSILKVLAFPFILLSLGLLVFVINAAMLMLTSKIADSLDIPFHVDQFFWTAVIGALITSVVSCVVGAIVKD